MTRIYVLVNQKGGVGKTTTTLNLGAYLLAAGQRVLLVDLDPQANLTSSLGIDKRSLARSVYNTLVEDLPPAEAILPATEVGPALLPSAPSLAGAEVELVPLLAREFRLQQALATLDGQYDYVLIDCPPSLGLLTVNGLTAARDGVIVPVQCEYLALEGISQLMQTINLIRSRLNPNLTVRGFLLTMYDGRTNLSQQVVDEVRGHFPNQVFNTIIPRNVRLSEAPSYGQSILTYAPRSPGAQAYQALARELLQGDHGE